MTVNGVRPSGAVPSGSASTLSRQVVRSGVASVATLTLPASALVVGRNTVAFTRVGSAGANGMGYDTVILAVDEGVASAAAPGATLAATLDVKPAGDGSTVAVAVAASNAGAGHAMDARLHGLEWVGADGHRERAAVARGAPDPYRCPLPLGAVLGAGAGGAPLALRVAPPPPWMPSPHLEADVRADGGRAAATASAPWVAAP